MAEAALTHWQRRVVILGWVTYAAFYLGRSNLATALPAIQSDLEWSPEQISLLAGAGIWTYSLGQLINGWLGQYVDSRRIVFLGIAGSTLLNLLFASASALPVMLILAFANGFLQSMGWGPILRTLSDALTPEQRQRVAGVFGASYVVGNVLTWALTSLLLREGQWRLNFVVPPLIMLGVGVAWYLMSVPARSPAAARFVFNKQVATSILRQFWPILIVAVVAGALFAGALNYAPSYVAQTLPLDQSALAAVILPAFGLLGTVWLGARMLRCLHGDPLYTLAALLMLAAAARALALVLPPSTLAAMVLLAGMGITTYALTNVVLAAVPLTSAAQFNTSIIAGLMDAVHGIGGAAGSTMVGFLFARGGWTFVFGVWVLLPLIAAAIILAAIRQRALAKQEELI